MIYIIKNIYFNNNVFSIDLSNLNHDKIVVRQADCHFEIGDFCEVIFEKKKYVIGDKIEVPVNFLDFYSQSKFTTDELKLGISKYVQKIQHPNLRTVIDEMLNNELYYKYPAAKAIHHAYIGGLCEHSLSMLKISDVLIEQYELDRDLMYSAIILHDYCKIYELTDYGLNYSLEGNLIGHITMCIEEIGFIARMSNINTCNSIIALKHMILSHHGKYEYGSAKLPMTLEAYVLSIIDELDAKAFCINNHLKDSAKMKLSSPLNSFDRRRFIKIK